MSLPDGYKEWKERSGLNTEQIANRIGVPHVVMVHIENGNIAPRYEHIVKIESLMGVNIFQQLFGNAPWK